MPLARQWSFPQTSTTTEAGDAVVVTPVTGAPGFNAGLDSLQVPNIITAPANSASVYAPGSYVAATASTATVIQNTLGYDAVFVAYFQGAASVATFQVGSGTSATAAGNMTAVTTGITAATTQAWDFPVYVPASYYFYFFATQANGASVPSGSLTVIAHPV